MMTDPNLPDDDALLFFHEMVEPTVDEFMKDHGNRRRGCLACLVIASMTEHYFHARLDPMLERVEDFKSAISSENRAVEWITDVANGTKHVVRKKKLNKIGYADVQRKETGLVGILRAGWPIGGEEVLVGRNHEWRLSNLIETAMTFWRGKLGLPSDTQGREKD